MEHPKLQQYLSRFVIAWPFWAFARLPRKYGFRPNNSFYRKVGISVWANPPAGASARAKIAHSPQPFLRSPASNRRTWGTFLAGRRVGGVYHRSAVQEFVEVEVRPCKGRDRRDGWYWWNRRLLQRKSNKRCGTGQWFLSAHDLSNSARNARQGPRLRPCKRDSHLPRLAPRGRSLLRVRIRYPSPL
jgi:hypothetical protein